MRYRVLTIFLLGLSLFACKADYVSTEPVMETAENDKENMAEIMKETCLSHSGPTGSNSMMAGSGEDYILVSSFSNIPFLHDLIDNGRLEELKDQNDYSGEILDIDIEVGNAKFEETEIEGYEVFLDIFVSFTNMSNENMILYIPEWVSNSSIGPDIIHIDYFDENGESVVDGIVSGPRQLNHDADDYIILMAGESYCNYYTDYLFLSDQDSFFVDGEEISFDHLYPGRHWVKGYYNTFYPWFGYFESEKTMFEIYLPDNKQSSH